MKKGILLVLAALLIAGLFVSCNSDVATNKSGSEKDVAYVSFGNNGAKGLSTSTVMPDVPDVDDLDWYFKATKNNGIIRTGEVTAWTCINTAGGLSGTIGPFAVGNWTFELVAVNHGATAPSTETYYDGTWHYGSKVVYVGRNADVDLVANTSSTPTLIAIALERVNVPTNTVFEVNANGIKLLDSSTDSFGSGNVYYTLVIGTGTNVVGVKTKTLVEVTANTTAYVHASPETGYVYTPTEDGEIVEITLNLYESNAENAQIVKSATTSIAAFKGSVITITGSSDQIDAYATFDGDYQASVTTLNGLGNTTFFASLTDAFANAADGDIVKVLKNVELASTDCILVNNTVTLDLNGKTITGSHDPIFVLGSTTPTYQKSQAVLTHTGYLTVTGNGTITSSNYDIFVVFDDATLDVFNGSFSSFADVFNINGGMLNCFGGTFTSTATSNTNLIDIKSAATVNITGGTFTTQGAYGILIMNSYHQAALPAACVGGEQARFDDLVQVVLFDLPIFIFSDRTAVFHQFQQFHGLFPPYSRSIACTGQFSAQLPHCRQWFASISQGLPSVMTFCGHTP